MNNVFDILESVNMRTLDEYGITKEFLSNVSFAVSLGASTNKLKVTEDIVSTVISDTHAYSTIIEQVNCEFSMRVKAPESIMRKVQRHQDLRFQSVFNDILGIRLKVKDYNIEFPEYVRVVDMRNGKAIDDGYRSIHLYYKKDNYHYPIEIQLWSEQDYLFNEWSHTYGYKILESDILLTLRKKYDIGVLKSYDDYERELGGLYNA